MPIEQNEKEVELSSQDDDAPGNFIRVEKGPGALLKTRRNIEHVMKIKDRQFGDLEEGDVVLSLYDFSNTKTNERVLIFLVEETRYMYMTKEFEDDFEIMFAGTYEYPAQLENINSDVLSDVFFEEGAAGEK